MKTENLPLWNLEAIYADLTAWESDFAHLKPLAEAFAAYRGRLAESPEVFAEAIEAYDAFERLAEKVYVYAHLRSDENTGDSANRGRQDRVESLFAELSPTSAWFEPEVMQIPLDTMEKMLKSKALKFYERSIRELLRDRPHTLTEPEERLIGTLSEVLGAPGNTFELLNDADLDFGSIRGADGKAAKLTHGSYRRFLEENDREVRRRAFRKMFGAYHKLRNTFASTLDATVKCHAVSAKIRNYPSALAASLSSDNVPESVYRNLITAVHEKLPALHDYLNLRRQVMKLDKLDMYDLYNPLLPACRTTYSWDQAVKTVKAAFAPLGAEYGQILERAFADRWIDVPERKGKRSGAYSSGCYDTAPYILLNYNGTLNDVFTLAHELGHSMHSFYSHAAQPYHYASYSIFVAEVASTTNEILLFEHLLKSTKKKELRAYLLNYLADSIRATIYRQTMFAEFELQMHELAEAKVPLSADLLCEKYTELNAAYFGNNVKPDPLIAMEWARIPHFYYNFYVYKYATGMSAAIDLAAKILHGTPAQREAYLNFLRAGDSKDVLEIMKDASVDLSSPTPIHHALDYFQSIITRLRSEL